MKKSKTLNIFSSRGRLSSTKCSRFHSGWLRWRSPSRSVSTHQSRRPSSIISKKFEQIRMIISYRRKSWETRKTGWLGSTNLWGQTPITRICSSVNCFRCFFHVIKSYSFLNYLSLSKVSQLYEDLPNEQQFLLNELDSLKKEIKLILKYE